MATLDELIGSWTLSLRAANRAPRSVAQDVDESLAQFRRGMAEHEPDVAPAAINRQHVESYLAEIASTRSASTAQTRYKAQGAMPHRRNGKARRRSSRTGVFAARGSSPMPGRRPVRRAGRQSADAGARGILRSSATAGEGWRRSGGDGSV